MQLLFKAIRIMHSVRGHRANRINDCDRYTQERERRETDISNEFHSYSSRAPGISNGTFTR